ncbi:phosphatidylserine decarboxylase family protein [Gracilimonas mengyeensis]|uniref:Phosphatidylserine decarboxylase proenzyme n=1 Tax=Gracilimonas mengyeensis TaxID=1302730 RepID=A0A521ALZ6_9BACT|nr:phosphatidylserine decarboxylase family protein [Gracilimonas mengyeensis]SMO35829.1 phosphatidylserine decarboxylase [Gracilimonas mengyeensis]
MISREGFATIAIVGIVSALISIFAVYFLPQWIAYAIMAVFVVLTALTVFFFRDPERTPPANQDLIISPADGKVVFVKEVEEDVYLKEKATQISIFLSPLNVHVNRNPVSGLLEYVKYHPGEYLMAWTEHASELNERADFGVKHPSGTKIFFRQITGFLARRIVYNIGEGDQLKAGERFGIMKFGSRMDIVVPGNVKVKVQPGDTTVAGESILGEIK